MGTFSDLIEYLRLNRRDEEATSEPISEVILTLLENENEIYIVDKDSFETDM